MGALWLLAAVPSALASPPKTIAGPGSAAGQVGSAVGVAVDDSNGELYVADPGSLYAENFRIAKFNREGKFQLAWGWGVADGKSQELQVCGPGSGRSSPRCFEAAREGSDVASGPRGCHPPVSRGRQRPGLSISP